HSVLTCCHRWCAPRSDRSSWGHTPPLLGTVWWAARRGYGVPPLFASGLHLLDVVALPGPRRGLGHLGGVGEPLVAGAPAVAFVLHLLPGRGQPLVGVLVGRPACTGRPLLDCWLTGRLLGRQVFGRAG